MARVDSLSLSQMVALDKFATLARRAQVEHPLRQLFWECTLRCNLACRHCGSDCKVSSVREDMPFTDFAKALDSIAAATDPHKVMVVITGGEPLMRPDLEKCGVEIYRRGFPWGMVTNGLALTPERFASLRRSGLHSITISLDGMSESHDWMRGRNGSWNRAADAIKMVASSGILHDVVTCVNKKNLSELPQIRDFLIESGVAGWRIFTVFPQGRAKNDPDMFLTAEELRTLMEFIKKTRKEGRIKCSFACEGFLGSYEGQVRDHFYFCNAGISIASILADGSIGACSSIRADYHQGNIYQDDFWTVWTEKYQLHRDRSWMRKGICEKCRFFKYCEGNGFHLRDENGDIIQCLLNNMKG